jgi:hypothetical protein
MTSVWLACSRQVVSACAKRAGDIIASSSSSKYSVRASMVAATEAQYSLSSQDTKRFDAVCMVVIVSALPCGPGKAMQRPYQRDGSCASQAIRALTKQ